MTAYVYIVRCADDALYTGWTSNLERRIAQHNSGQGAKYTRSRLPVQLVYFETFPNRSAAQRREYQIKRMSREKKLALLENE